MKVSLVVPLYNCLPLTQAMLASLRVTLPAGLAHEIIFVDDGSTDGTRAWLGSLTTPCRVVLNDRNFGFAGACNRGAAAATGEHLFFLNNDLVLLPGWFEPMLAACEQFPNLGLVGNVQLNVATGAVDHAGIYFNHQGKPAHRTDVPWTTRWLGWPAWRPADAVTGACVAIRRATWEKLGGFDTAFINGSEDIDLALRASAAGLHHYVALRSVVRHHISSSTGRNLRNEQNSYRLAQRWHERIAALAARDWSRQEVIAHADQSGAFDHYQVQAALAYLLVLRSPPGPVRDGVAAAMARERQRWRELLEGAPPPPPSPAVRTDEI